MAFATRFTAVCLQLCLLAGCSMGGFQGSDNPTSPGPEASSNHVSGVASKGIIRYGTVSLFALNSNGSLGAVLKKTGTDAFGNYSASVNMTGPTLFQASGAYTDECTGAEIAIPPGSPLRAAVESIANPMVVAITPLTELAVRKASPLLIAGSISAANQLISSIFKVDIIATQAVPPTAGQFSDTNVTQAQKDYTLALAAISQMAHDYYGGSVSDTLAAMNSDLARSAALDETGNQFRNALASFLQSDQNQTGIRDIHLTNLVNSGGSTLALRLAAGGTLPAGATISGITLTLTLPPGTTIRVVDFKKDSSVSGYRTDPNCVKASGNFQGNYQEGNFTPASDTHPASLTVSVAMAANTSLGEFLTVVCDLPAGVSYGAADFSVSDVKVVGGGDAVQIPGVTVGLL